MPKLQNGSKGRIRTRALSIESPAFYRWVRYMYGTTINEYHNNNTFIFPIKAKKKIIVSGHIKIQTDAMARVFFSHSISALLLVALFVRSACKLHGAIIWCYYLHGAIRFFVISCSANIYKPF